MILYEKEELLSAMHCLFEAFEKSKAKKIGLGKSVGPPVVSAYKVLASPPSKILEL
jgi:hypothetical protein